MSKTPRFPLKVRAGSVVVTIYRQTASSNASGVAYVLSWVGPNGREKDTFADLKEARDAADLKVSQLAGGLSAARHLSSSDIFELTESRAIAGVHGMPVINAMTEWSKARDLVGPDVIAACNEWARRQVSTLVRIKAAAAVDRFIEAKDSAKKKGTRTYTAKLKGAKEHFADWFLDSIPASEWTAFLARFEDGVTRNDIRKRIITMCRWAKKHRHLPQDRLPEIELTERAKETSTPIGILNPEVYDKLLHWFWKNHPGRLAAVVTAGLLGVRSDEIHGKRDDRDKRQVWEDFHLEAEQPFMSVTVAKENTPSNRIVHLNEAAVAWLAVCPGKRKGPICEAGAMEKVRALAIEAKFVLPENCFRHSWITYRIALTGDKANTATEAGNSVKEIDRRYRVPKPKFEGSAWFATRPKKQGD